MASGDARYAALWRTVVWLDHLFDDDGSLTTAAEDAINEVLRMAVPAIVDAEDPALACSLTRSAQGELEAALRTYGGA
jgi:hypothetical protein